jgi:uncharacterized protein (TIGR02678 family)
MVDPDDELTDVRMPAQGTESHHTLLLAEHIAAVPDGMRVSRLSELTRELARRHEPFWRKDATKPGAEQALVAQAVETLRTLRLVTVTPGDDPLVIGQPAIHRFKVAQPRVARSPVEAS